MAGEYYVYALIDPRNGKSFYIGKGKGARIHAHEKEAKRGSLSPKCVVINEIIASGDQVEKRILRTFKKESAAYNYEERLIKRIGLENLTNLASGGANPWRYKPDPSRMADRIYLKCYAKVRAILDRGLTPIVRWWEVEVVVPQKTIDLVVERGEEVLKRRGVAWCNRNSPAFVLRTC